MLEFIFMYVAKWHSIQVSNFKKAKVLQKSLPSLLPYLLEAVWKMGISKTGEPGSDTDFKITQKLQTFKNMHFNLCILVSTLQRQLASNQWGEDGETQFSLKSCGLYIGG